MVFVKRIKFNHLYDLAYSIYILQRYSWQRWKVIAKSISRKQGHHIFWQAVAPLVKGDFLKKNLD